MKRSIWIGFDGREQDAFEVSVASIRRHSTDRVPIFPVLLPLLVGDGLYLRPTEIRDGQTWDTLSGAPTSTAFAVSRFFVPILASDDDWALFVDCDVMARADIDELFALADDRYAIQCVHHRQEDGPASKMDGQTQSFYARKNWSSVLLWNVKHPANRDLTVRKLNNWPGRALHAFHWLPDELVGELPMSWNHLVGVHQPNPNAKIVHFTLGVPSMAGYEQCEHAEEWRSYLSGTPYGHLCAS